jgi:biopolymer transport protein ExbD
MQTNTPGVSRFLVPCIVLLVAGCLLTGCRSPSAKDTAGRPPPIELFNDGTVLFHGKPIEAGDLPRKLKSRGYEPGDPVRIVVPADAAPAALTQISTAIASAGFRRIIFVKARHAEAYVNKKKK